MSERLMRKIPITVSKSGGVFTAHSVVEYALTLCARDWRGWAQQPIIGIMEIYRNEDRERDNDSRDNSTGSREW